MSGLLKYGREDAMAPVGADESWIVVRAGEQLAGPFPTNADAWRWIDRSQSEPISPAERKAEDVELERKAARIRDRAIRRAGELLKQIDGQGRRMDTLAEGDHGKLTQCEVASAAGLSEHQQLQAVRVASIPADDFEKQVESATPPTVTALAQQGTKPPAHLKMYLIGGRLPGSDLASIVAPAWPPHSGRDINGRPA